jgi:hypothetical protein
MKTPKKPCPPGYVEVWTSYITLRSGKKLRAQECGLKAFHFYAPAKKR